jgi:hypothetical protein
MKLRILNFGINATHDLISNLHGFDVEQSISDFDACIYDPGLLWEGHEANSAFPNRELDGNGVPDRIDCKDCTSELAYSRFRGLQTSLKLQSSSKGLGNTRSNSPSSKAKSASVSLRQALRYLG